MVVDAIWKAKDVFGCVLLALIGENGVVAVAVASRVRLTFGTSRMECITVPQEGVKNGLIGFKVLWSRSTCHPSIF